MKKLLTVRELRNMYRPDEVLAAMQEAFSQHRERIIKLFSDRNCPLSRYKQRKQISFLDSDDESDKTLIEEIVDTLQDSVYFMLLTKKERTRITQRMRSFESKMVENQLARINLLLEDDQLGSSTPWTGKERTNKGSNRHRGLDMAFEILRVIKSDLEAENLYWKDVSRAGHLTGLQISMSIFFVRLKEVGMGQKDQITLVQQLFDELGMDWEEGDRENIKVSLQQPGLAIQENQIRELRSSTNVTFSKYLSNEVLKDLSDLSTIYKTQLRRF